LRTNYYSDKKKNKFNFDIARKYMPCLREQSHYTLTFDLNFLEAVFIGGNVELARQIYTNQGGFFDACQEGKLEKADAEWRKSDRQSDIEPYEHSFL